VAISGFHDKIASFYFVVMLNLLQLVNTKIPDHIRNEHINNHLTIFEIPLLTFISYENKNI